MSEIEDLTKLVKELVVAQKQTLDMLKAATPPPRPNPTKPRERPDRGERVVYVDQFYKEHDAFLERTYTIKIQTGDVDDQGRFVSQPVTYSDLCVNTKLDGGEKWVSIPGIPNIDEPYLRPKNRYFKTFSQVKGDQARAAVLNDKSAPAKR